jgi:hypothetical protein
MTKKKSRSKKTVKRTIKKNVVKKATKNKVVKKKVVKKKVVKKKAVKKSLISKLKSNKEKPHYLGMFLYGLLILLLLLTLLFLIKYDDDLIGKATLVECEDQCSSMSGSPFDQCVYDCLRSDGGDDDCPDGRCDNIVLEDSDLGVPFSTSVDIGNSHEIISNGLAYKLIVIEADDREAEFLITGGDNLIRTTSANNLPDNGGMLR